MEKNKKNNNADFQFPFFIFIFLSFPPQAVTNTFVLFSHFGPNLMLCFQAVVYTDNCSK